LTLLEFLIILKFLFSKKMVGVDLRIFYGMHFNRTRFLSMVGSRMIGLFDVLKK